MPQGIVWQGIGPAPISASATQRWAGRVLSIAPHPTDPNAAYIGSAQGGVWKTTDAGNTWTPLSDKQCSLAISSVAVDPINPNIVYAGTGEQSYGAGASSGCGVLRTTDGGQTWTRLGGSVFPLFPNSVNIQKILIHPGTAGSTTATTIFAASNAGIYRSLDSGVTYSKVLAPLGSYSPASDIVVDPQNFNTYYAGALAPSGNDMFIYKSVDGGGAWSQLTNGWPAGIQSVKLAVSPSSPSIVYASASVLSTHMLRMFKSSNGGSNWSELALGAINAPQCGSQCNYDMALAVDPNNANIVYFGGIGLYKSLDGGLSWLPKRTIHPDHHSLAIDSLGRLFIGNDGGVARSDDGAATLTNLNGNLSITQFYQGIALHPADPNLILGGTQDNGTVKFSGSTAWSLLLGGDGFYTAIDYSNPSTLYGDTQDTCLNRSDNGGITFISKHSGIPSDECGGNAIAMSPADSRTLLLAGSRIYRTNDRGESWAPISPSTPFSRFSTVAFAPSAPSSTYYAASNTVIRTDNAGGTWNDVTGNLSSLAFMRPVHSMTISPSNPDVVYVTLFGFDISATGSVFRTSNGGASWQNITANLPNIPVNAMAVDWAASPAAVYVGTNAGVYVTTDGASWQPANNGLPLAAVMDLAINRTTGYLVAATHGRGMFRAVLPSISPMLAVAPLSLSVSWQQGAANPASQTISITGVGGPLNYTVALSTQSGGLWLSAGPLSGVTPGTVAVSFNPTGLSPGSYSGSIAVAAPGASNSPIVIPVTLTVTPAPSAGAPTAVFRDISGGMRLTSFGSSTLQNAGGVFGGDPGVAQKPNGDTVTIARDNYNGLWINTFSASAQTWAGWTFAGGVLPGVPGIAVTPDGTAWFAGRDSYGAYYMNSYSGGTFGGWQGLGGVFGTDPSLAAASDGSVYLIARDNYGGMWSGRYIPGAGFQGWNFGGGITRGKPSAAAGSDGAVFVAMLDPSNSIWMGRVQGNTWSTWQPGHGVMATDPQTASAGSAIYAVCVDASGSVWYNAFPIGTANNWQGWTSVHGLMQAAAASVSGSKLYVIGREAGGTLWWQDTTGGGWIYLGYPGTALGQMAAAPH